MMKELLAYLTAAFVGPISCILAIMFYPPQKSKSFRVTNSGMFIEAALAGFVSVWLGKFTFYLFNLNPTHLMVYLIGIFFFLNFLVGYINKKNTLEIANVKLLGGIGSLFGVVIGGICIL
jgi:ABC-type Mn2+/Zn2+ transport system permease subunit